MGANYRSPRPPGSRPGKQECPSERQSICLMPNCSWMSTPDGISGGLTTPSSCTACSYMPLGRDRWRQRGSSAEANGKPYRVRSRGYLPHCTTGGVLDLLKGNAGPVPWGIPTKETAWPTSMWTPIERRSYPGHLVFADEPFVEVQRCHHCPPASPPSGSLVQVPQEEKPAWGGPLTGQGSSPAGTGGHLHTVVRHRETKLAGGECPAPMPP